MQSQEAFEGVSYDELRHLQQRKMKARLLSKHTQRCHWPRGGGAAPSPSWEDAPPAAADWQRRHQGGTVVSRGGRDGGASLLGPLPGLQRHDPYGDRTLANDAMREAAVRVARRRPPGPRTHTQQQRRLDPAALTRMIKQRDHWTKVRELIVRNEFDVNHIHIAAALTHVAQITQIAELESWASRGSASLEHGELLDFVQDLNDMARGFLPQFDGRQLSNMMWALAKLRCGSPQWFDTLAAAALPRLAAQPVAQHVSSALWAAAELRRVPHAGWVPAMEACLLECLPAANAQDLATAAYSLGELQVGVRGVWIVGCVVLSGGGVVIFNGPCASLHASAAEGILRAVRKYATFCCTASDFASIFRAQ